MKLRLLVATALLGVAAAPFTASANMGCQAVPAGTTDPDVARSACYTAVGLIPPMLCDKYRVCFG